MTAPAERKLSSFVSSEGAAFLVITYIPFGILNNMEENTHKEEFRVDGEELLKKVKEIIAAGNARRIIVKNELGETVVEIPLTIGALGAIIAPALAAVGAIAALVTKCTIIVEKK